MMLRNARPFSQQQQQLLLPAAAATPVACSSSWGRRPHQLQQQQQQQPHQQPHQQHQHQQHHLHCAPAAAHPPCADAATGAVFEEQQYERTAQAVARHAWAADVRAATGRQHHIVWAPQLSPPPLLQNVAVVLVGPKKPVSCGTVARACSCFECEDLRLVAPRCRHNNRNSRSVSKGAQYILHRAVVHDNLADALADTGLSIAFTRWLPGGRGQQQCLQGVPALLQHPVVQQLLRQQPEQQLPAAATLGAQQQQQHQHQQQQQQQHQQPPVRMALVLGREDFGLSDEEVACCSVAASIDTGRLQESLSLSHAASIVLAQLYSARLAALAALGGVSVDELPAAVSSAAQMAPGYDKERGVEK